MSTVEARLLADLIAHVALPRDGRSSRDWEERRAEYSAKRVALAEQESTTGAPTSFEARIVALEANSHEPIDLTPAIVEILDELGIKPAAPAELPRADWIEGALKRAHERAERRYDALYNVTNGYGVAETGVKVQRIVHYALDTFIAAMPAQPIDIVLFCPACALQHVDAPEPGSDWTNPPHKSHLCHGCGTVWRPADVPTNGVNPSVLKTAGEKDDPWPVIADRKARQSHGAEPQLEEVPADVRHDARAKWIDIPHERGADPIDFGVKAGWNAARRYSPMPPRLTSEMKRAITAYCVRPENAKRLGVLTGGETDGIVEAALSAAPPDAQPEVTWAMELAAHNKIRPYLSEAYKSQSGRIAKEAIEAALSASKEE